MASVTRKAHATLEDLHRYDGKAELIAGRIVPLMPTGYRPGAIAAEIYSSLRMHARTTGRGIACTDNAGYAFPELPSGRESFSPDASFYLGPLPADGMDFVPGPPTFAVEVRSKGDYGKAAEAEIAAKRADYFQAGTRVVWDVDPRDEIIRSYRVEEPDRPIVLSRGQVADAEPAVEVWRSTTSSPDFLFTRRSGSAALLRGSDRRPG